MARERFHNLDSSRYESLHDSNLLILWSESGSDWGWLEREASIEAGNRVSKHKESSGWFNQTVAIAASVSLVLLSIATWLQASETAKTSQAVDENSVQQLVLEE